MNEKIFYGIDLVWCIDGTRTPMMENMLNVIKNNASHFWQSYLNAMKLEGKDVGSVRVRVIVFRDLKYHPAGIEESRFFKMPEEEQLLVQHVRDIELTVGNENTNYGLEAFATALKSKWNNKEQRNRNIIVLFSDKETYQLNGNKDLPCYPSNMPTDLAQLGAWWEGEEAFNETYIAKNGRLVCFVPSGYPWNEITGWNRYWPTFIKDKELSFQEVIDILTGSF